MKLFLVALRTKSGGKAVTVDRAPDAKQLTRSYKDASASTGEKLLSITELKHGSPAARSANFMLALSDINPSGTLSDDFNELLTMAQNLKKRSK